MFVYLVLKFLLAYYFCLVQYKRKDLTNYGLVYKTILLYYWDHAVHMSLRAASSSLISTLPSPEVSALSNSALASAISSALGV